MPTKTHRRRYTPVRHRNPEPRAGNSLGERNHPAGAAVGTPPPPVGVEDNHPAVVAVGSRRVAVVAGSRPAAAEAEVGNHPEAAVVGSRPEAAVVGNPLAEEVVDRSSDLPEVVGGVNYMGTQTVVMILSAIVCLLASHNGNR
jgi:hypothetical protein